MYSGVAIAVGTRRLNDHAARSRGSPYSVLLDSPSGTARGRRTREIPVTQHGGWRGEQGAGWDGNSGAPLE